MSTATETTGAQEVSDRRSKPAPAPDPLNQPEAELTHPSKHQQPTPDPDIQRGSQIIESILRGDTQVHSDTNHASGPEQIGISTTTGGTISMDRVVETAGVALSENGGHICGPGCNHSSTQGLDTHESSLLNSGGSAELNAFSPDPDTEKAVKQAGEILSENGDHICGPGCNHNSTQGLDTHTDNLTIAAESELDAFGPSRDTKIALSSAGEILSENGGHICGPGCNHGSTEGLDTHESSLLSSGGSAELNAFGPDPDTEKAVRQAGEILSENGSHICGPGCNHNSTQGLDTHTDDLTMAAESELDAFGVSHDTGIALSSAGEILSENGAHVCGPGCNHSSTQGLDTHENAVSNEAIAAGLDAFGTTPIDDRRNDVSQSTPSHAEKVVLDQEPAPKIAAELRQVTRIIETNGVTQSDKALQAELLASALQSLKNQPASPQANGDRRVLNELRQAIPERVTRTFGERVGDKLAARTHTPDSKHSSRTHSRASQPEQRSDRPTRHHARGEPSTRQESKDSIKQEVRSVRATNPATRVRPTTAASGTVKRAAPAENLRVTRDGRVVAGNRTERLKQNLASHRARVTELRGKSRVAAKPKQQANRERTARLLDRARETRTDKPTRAESSLRNLAPKQREVKVRELLKEKRGNIQRETGGKESAPKTEKQIARREQTSRMLQKSREARTARVERKDSVKQDIRTLREAKAEATQSRSPAVARKLERGAPAEKLRVTRDGRVVAGNRTERLKQNVASHRARVTELRGKPRVAVTPKQQANRERTARLLDRAREIRATKPARAESSLRNLAPKQREAKIRTLLKEKRTAIHKELKSKDNTPKTVKQLQRRAATSRMLNKARTRRVERLSKKGETKKSVRHAKVTERRGKELKRTQVRLKTLAAKKRPLSISKDGRVRVASRIERRGLKLKALPQKRLALRSAPKKQLPPKQATRRLQRAAVTQRLRARAPERRPRLSPLPRAKRLPLIRKALTNKRAELQRLNRSKAPTVKPRTRNLLRKAQAKRALRTQNKKQLQKRVARVNRKLAPKKQLRRSAALRRGDRQLRARHKGQRIQKKSATRQQKAQARELKSSKVKSELRAMQKKITSLLRSTPKGKQTIELRKIDRALKGVTKQLTRGTRGNDALARSIRTLARLLKNNELSFSKEAANLFTQLEMMQGKKRKKKLGSNREEDGDLLEEEQAAMEVAELLRELTLLGDKPEQESAKEESEQQDVEIETSKEQDSRMFVSASNEGPKAELDILLVKQIDDTGGSDAEDSELARHMAMLQENLTRELMAEAPQNQ